jgi:hypothetical protein
VVAPDVAAGAGGPFRRGANRQTCSGLRIPHFIGCSRELITLA